MKKAVYSGIYVQRANPESPSQVCLNDMLVPDSDKEYLSCHKRLFSSINKVKLNKSLGEAQYGFRGRRFVINGSFLECDSVGRKMAYLFYTIEQSPEVAASILAKYASRMNLNLPEKTGTIIERAFKRRKAQQVFISLCCFVIIVSAIIIITWKH